MGKKNQPAGVGSREERHKLKGEEAYLKLKNTILSPEGKDIVAADPDLSPVTLNKLIALQKGNLKDVLCSLSALKKTSWQHGLN